MKNKTLAALVLAILSSANPQFAQAGSDAGIAAGGLIPSRATAVAIEKESITISQSGEEIRVDYTFRNLSNADEKLIVAFPIPEAVRKNKPSGFGVIMLRYALSTGKSCGGAISELNITIEKEDPAELVSLCLDGIKNIGPKTFSWHGASVLPDKDLDLMFLQLMQ